MRATGRIVTPATAMIELEFSCCCDVTANQRRWYFYDRSVPKIVWTKDEELHGRIVLTVVQNVRLHLVTSSGCCSGACWEWDQSQCSGNSEVGSQDSQSASCCRKWVGSPTGRPKEPKGVEWSNKLDIRFTCICRERSFKHSFKRFQMNAAHLLFTL